MSKPFIDNSQYQAYLKCPWYWWEKYVQQTAKAPKPGQRDDVLTLGSLVHKALECLRRDGRVEIPDATIAQLGPTAECLAWARRLALGYQQNYPAEEFTRYFVEEPLRFPVHYAMDGLAKIDSYFHVEKDTRLSDGLGGEFWLTPGWWIKEYKTKDVSKKLENYILDWRVNMQASFQMLALSEKIKEPVQGLLVDVIEKPSEYRPERTCKGCKGKYELKDWQPTGEGYACPGCQHVQALDTSNKSKVERVPKYYRLMVTRNEKELMIAREEILIIASEMLSLLMCEELGHRQSRERADYPEIPLAPRDVGRCVDSIYGPCEYFFPHSELVPAKGWEGFTQIEAFSYVT